MPQFFFSTALLNHECTLTLVYEILETGNSFYTSTTIIQLSLLYVTLKYGYIEVY
jgi:hypothetical protein